MRICLYEDRRAADLYPLALTRPASDLLCGLSTLGEKQARHFGSSAVGYLCRPALAPLLRARGAPANDPTWLRAAPAVLVNARWLPPAQPQFGPFVEGPHVALAGGEIAYAVLDQKRLQAVSPGTVEECLRDWAQTLPARAAGGTVISRAWELIDRNGEEIARDADALCDPADAGLHPNALALVGPADRLFVHRSATVDPMVVADTTRGPVIVGEGAQIGAFTKLEGPCFVGPHTHVHGARVRGGTSIGPHCRIGGEIECSVILGYSNKYHDGFLGHSYLGEWVNVAAGSATADLRYDYAPVRAALPSGDADTGRMKLGALIGDHAKTGLGALLDAGTVLGPFAQVVPNGTFAPRSVPAFHRATPKGVTELDAEKVLKVADVVMRRRGRALTAELETAYRALLGAVAKADPAPVTLPLRKTA